MAWKSALWKQHRANVQCSVLPITYFYFLLQLVKKIYHTGHWFWVVKYDLEGIYIA